MNEFLILIPIFYFLIIFQQSFLVKFSIFGVIPNLVLILVFLLNFLVKTDREKNLRMILSFIGGLLLDIHSGLLLGSWALNFLIIAILIDKFYQFFEKSNFLWFPILFCFCLYFSKIFLNFISLKYSFNVNLFSFFIVLLYSLFLFFIILFALRITNIYKSKKSPI